MYSSNIGSYFEREIYTVNCFHNERYSCTRSILCSFGISLNAEVVEYELKTLRMRVLAGPENVLGEYLV